MSSFKSSRNIQKKECGPDRSVSDNQSSSVTLKLEIERGRYFNIPREERKCKLCHVNSVENEYHFLLVCPLYRELRKKYLKSYYCRWPTLNKFDQLMSSKSKNELFNLSKYIYFVTKLRDENDT